MKHTLVVFMLKCTACKMVDLMFGREKGSWLKNGGDNCNVKCAQKDLNIACVFKHCSPILQLNENTAFLNMVKPMLMFGYIAL